jgi:small subunit ribosomal protein S20
MASHDSAIKKHRRDQKRRLLNRQHRSRLRTQIKKMRAALDAGNADAARGLLSETLSIVDRTAKLGVIHDNTAARTKSRLTRALARLTAGA